MAKIGLKRPTFCTITGDAETQGTGKIMAKAIKADIKINVTDIKTYGDDDIDESIKEFKDGSITQELNDIDDEISSELLGHKFADGELTANVDDIAPYVRVGFVTKRLKDKKITYRAIVFLKVQYGIPDESYETRGEKTELKSSTIVGTIYRNKDGDWKKTKTCITEEDAIKYLNTQVNLIIPVA